MTTASEFIGTIKPGAPYWQDCSPFVAGEEAGAKVTGVVFRFKRLGPDRFKGVADGFGSFAKGETYGNGAVYANGEDIEGVPVDVGSGI